MAHTWRSRVWSPLLMLYQLLNTLSVTPASSSNHSVWSPRSVQYEQPEMVDLVPWEAPRPSCGLSVGPGSQPLVGRVGLDAAVPCQDTLCLSET